MNKTVPLNKIKLNPNNPRTIRDDKFKKLVESLKSFPEMMKLRPIVVNKNMIILGGNMRYEAAKAAGWKEIDIIIADKLTKRQEEEFIIKDNMPYGEWDFDILANEFETEDLVNWGFEGYELGLGIDKINEKQEWDENDMPEFNSKKEIVLVVYFKNIKMRENFCKQKKIIPTTKREGGWTLRI